MKWTTNRLERYHYNLLMQFSVLYQLIDTNTYHAIFCICSYQSKIWLPPEWKLSYHYSPWSVHTNARKSRCHGSDKWKNSSNYYLQFFGRFIFLMCDIWIFCDISFFCQSMSTRSSQNTLQSNYLNQEKLNALFIQEKKAFLPQIPCIEALLFVFVYSC